MQKVIQEAIDKKSEGFSHLKEDIYSFDFAHFHFFPCSCRQLISFSEISHKGSGEIRISLSLESIPNPSNPITLIHSSSPLFLFLPYFKVFSHIEKTQSKYTSSLPNVIKHIHFLLFLEDFFQISNSQVNPRMTFKSLFFNTYWIFFIGFRLAIRIAQSYYITNKLLTSTQEGYN